MHQYDVIERLRVKQALDVIHVVIHPFGEVGQLVSQRSWWVVKRGGYSLERGGNGDNRCSDGILVFVREQHFEGHCAWASPNLVVDVGF